MNIAPSSKPVRLAALGLTCVVLGLLTGCISYKSTGATPTDTRHQDLTGSHIPTEGLTAKAAAQHSGSALTVYDRSDLERSGATDVAAFLQHVPSARVRY